jgi:hypothetical protein
VIRALGVLALILSSGWLCAEPSPASDDAASLRALSAPMVIPGATLWLTVLTDRTVDALWRDAPAHDNLRSIAAQGGTLIYVMGVATGSFSVTGTFAVEQGGRTMPGRLINIARLGGELVREGDSVLGVVEFRDRIDLTRPFVVKLQGSQARFDVNPPWTGNAAHR